MKPGITAAIAGAALTAVTFAQTVNFDYDRAATFSAYRTYAWVAGTNVPDQLIHQRLVAAVDGQLAAKGLSKVGVEARPDVLVAYHASVDKDLRITGFSSGWGGYRFGGTRSGTARTEQILVGTMIVDVIDAATKNIVWRGSATKDIDVNAKPDKRDKNINKTAEKLLKNYPPQ